MIIFNSTLELKNYLTNFQNQSKQIGFVPTMGALHKGHISLINTAKKECDIVVCSIFVNPTQFNDINDLEAYPRTIELDCTLLEQAACDVVFIPEVNEIYTPYELELKKQQIEDTSWMEGKKVDFGQLDKVMEGKYRPGHFNGMAQVVSKLFRIVMPAKAYFGQKDFQQLAIIRSMVKQLDMPVEIVACPIIRETDGLAMSSRNRRLTPEQRQASMLLSKILFNVQQQVKSKKPVALLKLFVEKTIQSEALLQLEYFEIVNAETLESITQYSQAGTAMAFIAAKAGNVRLIDNVVLY